MKNTKIVLKATLVYMLMLNVMTISIAQNERQMEMLDTEKSGTIVKAVEKIEKTDPGFVPIPNSLEFQVTSGKIVKVQYVCVQNIMTGEKVYEMSNLSPDFALIWLKLFAVKSQDKAKYLTYTAFCLTQNSKTIISGSMVDLI